MQPHNQQYQQQLQLPPPWQDDESQLSPEPQEYPLQLCGLQPCALQLYGLQLYGLQLYGWQLNVEYVVVVAVTEFGGAALHEKTQPNAALL